MLNRITKLGHQAGLVARVNQMGWLGTKAMATSSARSFATKREDVYLNPKWVQKAEKETKNKVNIRQQLVRETNEQMLVKPIYTSEDFKAPEKPELSGKLFGDVL